MKDLERSLVEIEDSHRRGEIVLDEDEDWLLIKENARIGAAVKSLPVHAEITRFTHFWRVSDVGYPYKSARSVSDLLEALTKFLKLRNDRGS